MNAQVHEGEIVTVAQKAVAQFSEFDAMLAEFREKYHRVYDMDDPEQEKQARSDRYAIGKVIADLDRRHKAVKEPLLEATRLVDGARRRIKDELTTIQGGIKSQIEAKEAREAQRVQMHRDAIANIRELADFEAPPTAEQVATRLRQAQAVTLGDEWEEFKAEAALARTETIESLERLHAERQQAEAEAAELERLWQEKEERERREREERIAAEAEERARKEAEQEADRRQREADDRHARELREAQAAADRAAAEERERIEALQRERDAEAKRAAAAEKKRKQAKKHRERVEREAVQSLDMLLAEVDDPGATPSEVAAAIVLAIRDGKVAHVRIDY